MHAFRHIILAAIAAQLAAADPNTSPWPASGPVGIGTSNPSAISPHATLALDKTGGHNYLAISADLDKQSAISFNDRTHGQDIVLYRPVGTRDFMLHTSAFGTVMQVLQSGEVSFPTVTTITRPSITPLDLRPSNDANVWWRVSTSSVAHGGGAFTISNLGAGGNDPFQIMPSGETIIRGAAPASVPAGQVRMGGGMIRAGGSMTSATALGVIGTVGSATVGGGPMLQIGAADNSQNAILQLGAGGTLDVWTFAATSWVRAAQYLTSGTYVVNGAAPLSVGATQVQIGGGQLWTGGNIRSGGTIHAKEIKVTATPFADYVFADDYRLRPLAEVEAAIKRDRHLPGIPPAAEIERDGMAVSAIMVKQMEKIEELTLYAIQAERERQELRQSVQQLRAERNAALTAAATNEARLRRIEESLIALVGGASRTP